MKYKKEIFKEHYGKPYLAFLKYALWADLISFVLVVIFLLIDVRPPAVLVFGLLGILAFSIFILPLVYCYYIQALRTSERQKQWIEDGVLHVLLVPKNGFIWGAGFVKHTKEYIVTDVSSVTVTLRHITICGEMDMLESYNGMLSEKRVSKLKVPRNFDHEEIMLQYGGVSPTHH